MSYSQTLSITEVQRDSIYNKIIRGKANADRVVYLSSALKSCDSASTIKSKHIGIVQKQVEVLEKILQNDKLIIKNLENNIIDEKKRSRRRGFWNFVKGFGLGVGAATTMLLLI